jgi:glycosyltransferase involved in cell wall biosynthesis
VSVLFSIICPTYNEERYIGSIIANFIDNCPQPSELFIADGGSTDQTCQIVTEWGLRHSNVQLVKNDRKFVSFAFNLCYPRTRGSYIALLGAHTKYPSDFFSIALKELKSDTCDVVGGPLKQVGITLWGKVIAECMSTPFGVGGTEFRVYSKRMYVDSVAFACYKREIFEEVGLFDERLIRNQDDEMHYRINSFGLRILMVPEMQCEYQVRSDLQKLWKQYFEYGLYKPLVLRKVSAGMRFRHLVPALFCLYLCMIPIMLHFDQLYVLIPALLYGIMLSWFSFTRKLKFWHRFRALLVFPTLHVSYGVGFIGGLFKK